MSKLSQPSVRPSKVSRYLIDPATCFRNPESVKILDFRRLIPDCIGSKVTYRAVYLTPGCWKCQKTLFLQFIAWSFLFCHPVFAQEAIQIEIDSAPVEVEIQKPAVPQKQPDPEPVEQAKAPSETGTEDAKEKKRGYGVAIGIGVLVAGALQPWAAAAVVAVAVQQ